MKNKMVLKLFNTETGNKEPVIPINQDQALRFYTCGPTLYDYAHLGNFRTYVFEDLVRRTLEVFGISVKQVMNLTDVDDKTIRGALQRNMTLEAYTQQYKKAFFDDLDALSIKRAAIYPAATHYIPAMLTMIETLLKKGLAYRSRDGSIYYSIRHFPSYGRLSHLSLDALQTGASNRVIVDEYGKEYASDFVLWKSYDKERDGMIFWDSPFGKGRPGWHIECSAMARQTLGETIDLHAGGIDNIFPHHENEIAQSEGCDNKHPFVRYWIHCHHLIVDGKKMSKTLGNFYTLRDLLDRGFSGMEVRYLLLSVHYRSQLNFTLSSLQGARHAIQRIHDFIKRLLTVKGEEKAHLSDFIQKSSYEFFHALSDDLNISAALGILFDFIRKTNQNMDQGAVSKQDSKEIFAFLHDVNAILGVMPLDLKTTSVPVDIQDAFEKRIQARRDKNWAEADRLRDRIYAKGYVIEDNPLGSYVKKK